MTDTEQESLANRLELALEDLECVHLWLDDQKAPRQTKGRELSIVGRVQHLLNSQQQEGVWISRGCAEHLVGALVNKIHPTDKDERFLAELEQALNQPETD